MLLIYKIKMININIHVLIKGTASEVFGIDSETVLRKTVSDRRIVTSENVGFVLVDQQRDQIIHNTHVA